MARKRNNKGGRARKGTGSMRLKKYKHKDGTVTERYEIRYGVGSGSERRQKSESYAAKSDAEARLLLVESIIAAGKTAHKSVSEICAELSGNMESNDSSDTSSISSANIAEAAVTQERDPSDMTVDEWFHNWNLHCVKGVEATKIKYAEDYDRYVKPWIGNKLLRDVRPLDIQRMVDKWQDPQYAIRKPLAKKYVNDIHNFMRTCFARAIDNDLISKNPCTNIVLPVETKNERKKKKIHLSMDQITDLLMALRDAPHNLLYYFLAFFGLRVCETLGLTMQDVDMENHVIHLRLQLRRKRGKGKVKINYAEGESLHYAILKDKDPRDIYYDDVIAALLQQQINHEKAKKEKLGDFWPVEELERGDLLFSNNFGSYLSCSTVRDCFCRRTRQIIPNIRLHDLRHVYVSLAYKSGVPMEIIAEHVGHSAEELTRDVYLSVPDEMEIKSAADVGNTIKQLLAEANAKATEILMEDKR